MLTMTVYMAIKKMGVFVARPSFLRLRVLILFISAALLVACADQEQSKSQVDPQSTGLNVEDEVSAAKDSSVTIYRDQYGTPHVVADDNYGVYFGYGYAVATDRLFQMEMLRRTVEGRVAQVLGKDYLDLDKQVRTAYDHRAVAQQLKSLEPQDLEILQAYADGFSRRVEEVLADRDTLLPKEFSDFDFLPELWVAENVAMIFVGSIIHRYSDFNSELDSLGLINSLSKLHGQEKAKRIFDASKWLLDPSSPTTVPRTEKTSASARLSTTSQPSIFASSPIEDASTKRVVLDDKGKFRGTSDDPIVQASHAKQIANHGYISPEYASASNFWSVRGSKLENADGALVNGPQFGFGLPSYVYGIGLHGGDFNVVGNTLLGLPTMLFAHNNKVGWGSTAGMSDQVDVYREQLVEGKPEYYRHNGEDKAFESWTEVIQVRDAEPMEVKARRTVHGMVVQMDVDKGIAYARARAWEGAEVQTMMAWVNLAKDKTMDAVQSRLQGVAANINFYYMDVTGNIGYTHGGRYPLRAANHDSRIPAVGTGANDWLGFRPHTDNPSVRNPQQGYIVNWNNRPAQGWLASDLWTQTWSKAHRSWHIFDELNAKDTFSTDEVWAIAERVSYDDVNGSFLMPYLEQAMAKENLAPVVSTALQTLIDWNGEWRINQAGAYGSAELIIESWLKKLFTTVLLDDIGEEKFAMYSATNNPSNKLGPSMPSSVGIKVILRNLQLLGSDALSYDFFNGQDPNAVLSKTFTDTISALVNTHGSELSNWSLAPAPMVWSPYNFRGVPQASEDALVSLPAYMNRGSENNFFVANEGAFTAYDVIPPGQSGFVSIDGTASSNTNDQMDLYSNYELKTVPFTLAQIKAVAVSTESIQAEPKAYVSISNGAEKVQSALTRAEKFKDLGAMIYLDKVGAVARAKSLDGSGILSGLPIVVKDNTHVAGMPNTAGTAALRNFIPAQNNPSVQRLVDAGAVVIGKANMHELAFGITSNNATFAPVRNFHNPERIAGGSSGGTAVAVAAGIVEMGLGTDTGGSSRIPAALNGVVGFRPSQGRYPAGGVTPISSTRDTVGPMANNVTNTALLDCVITNCATTAKAVSLNDLRLGVPRTYFYENVSADVESVTKATLAKLAAAGVTLVEVEMPGLEAANNGAGFAVALYEFMQEFPDYLQTNTTGVTLAEVVEQMVSTDVKATVLSQMGEQAIPESAYREAIDRFRPELMAIYDKAFSSYDVAAMILPTTPLTATPIKTSDETVLLNGVESPTFLTLIRNTDPTSNAGLPSLTLPAGVDSEGLPIGIMLDGPNNSDRQLFNIALAIESLLTE